MARDQSRRAKFARRRQEIRKLYGLIAANAGDGGFARHIARHEIVDDRLAEAILVIQHIMGDAESTRHAARVGDVAPRAAGSLAGCRRAMIVKLQRDADRFVARPLRPEPRPATNRRPRTWRPRCDGRAPARPIRRRLDQGIGSILAGRSSSRRFMSVSSMEDAYSDIWALSSYGAGQASEIDKIHLIRAEKFKAIEVENCGRIFFYPCD